MSRTWSPEVRALGDRIAALTMARAAELSAYLNDVHGVRAPRPSVVIPIPEDDHLPDWDDAEPAELDVVLEGCDANRRVAVIRALREVTGLGLKEARDVVDGAPAVVQRRLPPSVGEQLRARLEAAGAKVALRA
jgi:large subunit ribosomal protein L7/L12